MDDCSTNPFSDNYIDDIEDHVENEVETKEIGSLEKPPIHPNTVTVDAIAEYLINKQYILTALEFHTEILENGKELPRLRNYFSNPANFEQQATFRDSLHPGTLYRAGSCSTFDSLDLTRYSDDGNQQVDDRVAVLEFELRKAKETIKSLRENLTDAVENDTFLKSPTNLAGATELSSNKDHQAEQDTDLQVKLKPLEKRAINYLINEYLLHNDYKLTSITLADENEDQDFEDWDDVGLNMPKPPNLISLFRDSTMHSNANACYVTTSDYDKEALADSEQSDLVESLKHECSRLKKENTELSGRIQKLEMERNAFSSSTPRRASLSTGETNEIASPTCNGILDEHYHTPMKSDDVESDPEVFLTPVSQLPEKVRRKSEDKSVRIDEGENSSCTTASVHNGIAAEDAVDNHHRVSSVKTDPIANDRPPHSRMSNAFWNALLSYTQTELDKSWLVMEVSKVASTCEELVSTLARCLPKIVPTVLLQKRDQLIPLLLCTAAMHPSADERNRLLHDLFNLIKKPNACERQMILCGCVAYAKHVGPSRTEEDLLPQCWEQIGHKYPERRQLVCEACGAIAPYLRAEIRSSLLLSILQQVLQEERLDEVRQAVVKSLSIVFVFLDDAEKYKQAFEMLTTFLGDSSLVVMQTSKECLLPSFAAWSCNSGRIHDHLLDFALSSVEKIAEKKDANPSSFLGCMETLHRLMPHLFTYVLLKSPCQSRESDDEVIFTGDRQLVQCDALCDPAVVIGDGEKYTELVSCFDENIKNENFDGWELMHWCLNEFIPRLLRIVRLIDPGDRDCVGSLCHFFNDLCSCFGKTFVNTQLKKQFRTMFCISGKDADRQIYAGETPLTTAALAVYASGVLAVHIENESKEELFQFLKDMMVTLSSCHASLDSMVSCFLQIRIKDASYHELLLNVLWYGVTHSSVYVRVSAASLFVVVTTEDVDSRIISTRVLPALITLSTDMNSAVRTATIPALGAVIECSHISQGLIDHAIEQMATFLAPSYYDETTDSSGEQKQPHHDITMQLVRTMGHVCPKAHPKFRDEFVLPHLAAIAAGNNQVMNRTRRSDIALELLDAYSSISCCFISDNLLLSAFLPGVRCLLQDMEKLHPEHVDTVNKFIKDKETKLERGSINSVEEVSSSNDIGDSGNPTLHTFTHAVTAGADDAKRKILTTFSQLKSRTTTQSSSSIFKTKKVFQ